MIDEPDDAASGAGPLVGKLLDRIRQNGPISFAEFMESALYDPRYGYYTRGRSPWGNDGDYVTAPQVHPALGASIARLVAETDELLQGPDPFVLVEVGGGDGRLLAAVCEGLGREAPRLLPRLEIWSVERSEWLRERQGATLPPPADAAAHAATVASLPDEARWRGAVYSNELLDAFPVERVRMRRGRLEQGHVTARSGAFELTWLPARDPRLQEYLERNDVRLEEEQVADVCLSVAPWIREVATRLEEGIVLTIDYGAESAALYDGERRQGSLAVQARFRIGLDPLADPGSRDLTAHVDLGNLRRAGAEVGLSSRRPCSLRAFLIGTGAAESAAWPAGEGGQQTAGDRLRLRHLLVSEIGDAHRVLLQTKGRAEGLRFGLERLQG